MCELKIPTCNILLETLLTFVEMSTELHNIIAKPLGLPHVILNLYQFTHSSPRGSGSRAIYGITTWAYVYLAGYKHAYDSRCTMLSWRYRSLACMWVDPSCTNT